MFTLLKNSLADFRSTYIKYLSFAFIYVMLTSVVFVPLLTYIYNRILRGMDSSSLINKDVYTIVLSYTGFIGILVICFLSVIILFVQFGVMIILAHKKYFGKEIYIIQAFIATIKKIPKIFGLGILQLMFFLFLLFPIIDSPLTSMLLENINVPIFVTSRIHDFYLFVALYVILLIGISYLILRWIFVLHYILIEGKSLRKSFKCSLELTKNKKFNILIQLFLFNAFIYVLGFILVSLLSLLPSWVESNAFMFLLEKYLVTTTSFLTFVFTLLIMPINIIFLTRLFYRLKENQGEKIEAFTFKSNESRLTKVEKNTFQFFRRKRYLVISILVLYMTGVFLLNYSVQDQFVYLKWHIAVAAHRGDMANAPENTISSIRAAIDKEVDAVEIDVQMTKDGVVVLNHDMTLTRVAGISEQVSDLTYAEIAKLDVGSHHSEAFAGERIPTLNEAIEEISEANVFLIVEIKSYGPDKELAKRVVEIIEAYDAEEQVYIQSFDSELLQEIRAINSNIKLGQVMYIATGNLSELDVDFYTINQSMLSKRFIRKAHNNGREVWVWTVNIDRNIRQVLAYDIDGIITDYPEKVQKMISLR